MNKTFLFLLLGCLSFVLQAQNQEFTNEMSFLISALNLDQSQQIELEKILQKKYEDLKSNENLRAGNNQLFRERRRNIYKGAMASTRFLLNHDQLNLWREFRIKQRKENARLMNDLRAKNAERADIIDAQYGIKN